MAPKPPPHVHGEPRPTPTAEHMTPHSGQPAEQRHGCCMLYDRLKPLGRRNLSRACLAIPVYGRLEPLERKSLSRACLAIPVCGLLVFAVTACRKSWSTSGAAAAASSKGRGAREVSAASHELPDEKLVRSSICQPACRGHLSCPRSIKAEVRTIAGAVLATLVLAHCGVHLRTTVSDHLRLLMQPCCRQHALHVAPLLTRATADPPRIWPNPKPTGARDIAVGDHICQPVPFVRRIPSLTHDPFTRTKMKPP